MCTNKTVYYDSGEVYQEYSTRDGKVNGEFKEYYRNGNIKVHGSFKNGIQDGLFTFYYTNSIIQKKCKFSKGIEVDSALFYYPNGELKEISNFHNGTKEGMYLEFDSTGVLVKKGNLKEGFFDGYFIANNKLYFAKDGLYKNQIIDTFYYDNMNFPVFNNALAEKISDAVIIHDISDSLNDNIVIHKIDNEGFIREFQKNIQNSADDTFINKLNQNEIDLTVVYDNKIFRLRGVQIECKENILFLYLTCDKTSFYRKITLIDYYINYFNAN